jgi:F420-dependent oxidoreductase-like protein
MREYLESLLPLLRGEPVDVHGEDITCVGALDVAGAAAPDVIVAALGPQMLKLTGSMGCGTITWCSGERALLDHVVPRITEAAEAAGHPSPRVIAGLPVSVTTDVEATHAVIAEQLSLYGGLPSYRAMLDLDDAAGPADVAIIGDEEHVRASLQRLADGGVTEFSAVISAASPEDRRRTWELLQSLL